MSNEKNPRIIRACEPTAEKEFRRQIMDCMTPKSEREHWAAKRIQSLEEAIRRHEKLTVGGYCEEADVDRELWSVLDNK